MKKIQKSDIEEMLMCLYFRHTAYQEIINYACVYTRNEEYDKPHLDYSIDCCSSENRYHGEVDEETYKDLTETVKSYVYDKKYTRQEMTDILYQDINSHFQSFQ